MHQHHFNLFFKSASLIQKLLFVKSNHCLLLGIHSLQYSELELITISSDVYEIMQWRVYDLVKEKPGGGGANLVTD